MSDEGVVIGPQRAITTMSMAEIIRLQDRLSQELKRRFEEHLALGFSDIAGSTSYFERFGDEAGRKLQQRHFDFANQAAEMGPGAVLGERALIEGGRRTSTLRALTRCKVACVSHDKVDREKLEQITVGHRGEHE